MNSIFRAFGRTSKVAEKDGIKVGAGNVSQEKKEDSLNISEDDIFSNLVVSSPATDISLSCCHLAEIEDLDITKSETIQEQGSECGDVASSAFSFMNQGSSSEHSECGDVASALKSETIQVSEVGECGDDAASSAFSFMSQGSEHSECGDAASSAFSFMNQDLQCERAAQTCETIQGSTTTRQKNVKKKKSRVKPGYGNIDREHGKKSSSGISEESCVNVEDSSGVTLCKQVTENEDIHEETLPKNEYEKSDDTCSVSEINEIENDLGDDKYEYETNTNEGNIDCIQNNQDELEGFKREINIVDDSNLVSDDNDDIMKNEKCPLETIYSGHENVAMEDDVNIIASVIDTDTDSICDNAGEHSIYTSKCNDNITYEKNESKGLSSSNPMAPNEKCMSEIEDCLESVHSDNMDDDSDKIVFINNTRLTEEQNIKLRLDALQSQEEMFITAKSILFDQQQELINQWKSEHLSESSISLKINELQQLQMKLEGEEDYDKAADVNQTVMELMNLYEHFKYQYPLLDDKFLNLLKDYENLCSDQKNGHSSMLQEYDTILNWFKEKNNKDETNEEKKLNEMTLLLKEKKLKVERDISHTSLDKEHLIKNEMVLNEEIEKQTKALNKEKEKLNEKKGIIQTNIAELMAKLNLLQEEENDLSTAVVNIECKIQNIMDDFQPRINEISREKVHTEKEESRLNKKMGDLVAEEEEVKLRNTDILHERGKNQETISMICSNIERIHKLNELCENEMFSFSGTLDFDGLELNADKDLAKSKEHLKELQSMLEELSNKVLLEEAEEKRLQRSMNDLEAQLSELQKLKEVHVKDKKYKEAKMTSDEIRSLTSKGEEISHDALTLNENIKVKRKEIQELTNKVAKAQEKFDNKELSHDQLIIDKLQKMNISIENLLKSELESWTAGILELQLNNNKNIIHDLSIKHEFPTNV